MAADLFIPLPHGSAIQEVRAFQDGVLSILLFNAQQSLLQGLFLFCFSTSENKSNWYTPSSCTTRLAAIVIRRTVSDRLAIRSNSSTAAVTIVLPRLEGFPKCVLPWAPFGTDLP